MKITSINSISQPNNNKNNNPAFKGLTNGLINFWQFVDNGGRALQFTVEDMTGTNFPRSIKGLLAGKKYSGHYNIPAFLQEAIREFLTGPTMCTVPWVVMLLAKKAGGKSANIQNNNMVNLSYLLANKTNAKEGQALEDAFYKTVVEDMLSKSTDLKESELLNLRYKDIIDVPSGKNIPENEVRVVDKMIGYFKELGNNTDKKQEGVILNNIQDLFEKTVKHGKNEYEIGINFLNTKYTTEVFDKSTKQYIETTGATNAKDYAGYATSYIKDITKTFGEKISKEQIKNFRTSKQIYRVMTSVFGMIGLTGLLMFQIPKLYTKASGLVNPNASAIYDEAKKEKYHNNINTQPQAAKEAKEAK